MSSSFRWENLPSDTQTRIARAATPRDMQSLGRSFRSGRAAANEVHAERQRGLQSLRENTRIAKIMDDRTLVQATVAAIMTARAVGFTTSFDTLRRGGFEVSTEEDGYITPNGKHTSRQIPGSRPYVVTWAQKNQKVGDNNVQTIISRDRIEDPVNRRYPSRSPAIGNGHGYKSINAFVTVTHKPPGVGQMFPPGGWEEEFDVRHETDEIHVRRPRGNNQRPEYFFILMVQAALKRRGVRLRITGE